MRTELTYFSPWLALLETLCCEALLPMAAKPHNTKSPATIEGTALLCLILNDKHGGRKNNVYLCNYMDVLLLFCLYLLNSPEPAPVATEVSGIG